jgi:glycerol-3-phosphate acyltransferase PlsY
MGAELGWLLASYLLGAIPTSHIVSRTIARIDLREHGSGNLGATNLYRVLGWKYAVPVALFDIAKGAIPVLVFAPQASDSELFAVGCGVAAILGHVFSVFVGFKGGKGVATAAGVMLGLTPLALSVAALVWAVVVRVTGYVSLASIAAAAILPVTVYLLEQPNSPELLWIDILVAAGVIILHRKNIQRLIKGTENRFGRRAASSTPR